MFQTSGKKIDLINRLLESDKAGQAQHQYDEIDHDDLVSICNSRLFVTCYLLIPLRGLDVVGSTESLKQRLVESDTKSSQVCLRFTYFTSHRSTKYPQNP